MKHLMDKKVSPLIGCLGFLGFLGLGYFKSGNIYDLAQFAFFGFFAYFWLARVIGGMPDEEYLANVVKAKAVTGNTAIFLFVVMFLHGIFFTPSLEVLFAFVAIGFAVLVLSFGIALYNYEKERR